MSALPFNRVCDKEEFLNSSILQLRLFKVSRLVSFIIKSKETINVAVPVELFAPKSNLYKLKFRQNKNEKSIKN